MNRPVTIHSKMNNTCLTQSQGQHNTRPNDLIATKPTNATKQKWIFSPMCQNFLIKNCLSGNVLDVQGNSTQIYRPIICYKLHGEDNQLWKPQNYKNRDSGELYYLENVKTGLVLEIQGGIDAEGMRIVQNKMYGNANQLWVIRDA